MGLPFQPVSLAADTSCKTGQPRDLLEQRGIPAYIAIHPRKQANMLVRKGFEYGGTTLSIPRAMC